MSVKLHTINPELPLDIAANEAQAKFAEFTEKLSVGIGRMSAFVAIVFDDQGNPMSSWYAGDMFPIPTPMVPGIIKDIVTSDVYGGDDH